MNTFNVKAIVSFAFAVLGVFVMNSDSPFPILPNEEYHPIGLWMFFLSLGGFLISIFLSVFSRK